MAPYLQRPAMVWRRRIRHEGGRDTLTSSADTASARAISASNLGVVLNGRVEVVQAAPVGPLLGRGDGSKSCDALGRGAPGLVFFGIHPHPEIWSPIVTCPSRA